MSELVGGGKPFERMTESWLKATATSGMGVSLTNHIRACYAEIESLTRPPLPAPAGRPEFWGEDELEGFYSGNVPAPKYCERQIRSLQAYAETLEANVYRLNFDFQAWRSTALELGAKLDARDADLAASKTDRDAFQKAHAAEHDRRAELGRELDALKAIASQLPQTDASHGRFPGWSTRQLRGYIEELEKTHKLQLAALKAKAPAVETVNDKLRMESYGGARMSEKNVGITKWADESIAHRLLSGEPNEP